MSIACPFCQHVLTLKGVKPGRFTPTCTRCAKRFLLTVAADQSMTAGPLPASAKPAAKPPAPSPALSPTEATGEYQSPAAPADRTERVAVSAPPKSARPADATAPLPPGAPQTLGGYQILQQLGQGGMGTVYLARQLSLDRKVALKTMNPQWAADPRFLTRFVREAYAAAQLVHHNVIQIYDIGEDHGTHFFSMEFVPGTNLGQLVQKEGTIDVPAAVGYILQAARGLQFAHGQGMVHRDVKPDNLMLNDLGVVKVADLGLVKTPGAAAAEEADDEGAPAGGREANVTAAGVAIGTPTYMAPEQGLNAAGVDQRADIYSLGCTLYALLTGRPPFQGKSALEVMTKHLTEPVVRPEVLDKRVPAEVSDVLLKMLAKKPEERYADLGEVIGDLEKFLGVQAAGASAPGEEQARALEEAAKQFHAAPAARLGARILPGFFAACAALFVAALLFGKIKWATGALGVAVLTALFTFVVSGWTNRSHLFLKARELVLGSRWTDWLTWAVGLVLVLTMLWLFGLLGIFVGVIILAMGLTFAYHGMVDRKLATQRQASLDKAEQLLKSMRLRGVGEEALQEFVCKYSGTHWEELYETLFGYEALLAARQRWAATGRRRPRHAAWRDPVVRWIESRQKARQEARERKLLAKVEQKALEAKGVSATAARARAEEAADVLVHQAAELKAEARRERRAPPRPTREPAPRPRVTARQMARGTYQLAPTQQPKRRRRPLTALFRSALGPKTRFVAGAVLLGVCLLWARQNNLLSGQHLEGLTEDVLGESGGSAWARFRTAVDKAAPLPVPLVPEAVKKALFGSFNPGLAGLLLILSALMANLRLVSLCVGGAAVVLFGPLIPLPEGLPLEPAYLWGLAGAAVVVVGLVVSRFVR